MKYKLHKELLNDNNILSHVFLETIGEFSAELAKENKVKFDAGAKDVDIEITLTIAGRRVNPGNFFNLLIDQYDRQVHDTATKIVKEQTSEKLTDIYNQIDELATVVNGMTDEINWDYKFNPLQKDEFKSD